MLTYISVLFIIFTFILLPTYLVLKNEIYDDYYFENAEGRKILLSSKEKSNIKINYDCIYKNYSNSLKIIKKYFIFLAILFFVIFIYNLFSYNKIINYIIENQETVLFIFITFIIWILILINRIIVGFYFVDVENNKILYRKILFGNLKKVNGNITYKYFDKKNKIILNIKFRDGRPKYIELKTDKILTTKITIQEIVNDNFKANFIMIVDKKYTLMKGEGIFEFSPWLYGNFSDNEKIYIRFKNNFSKISCQLIKENYFFMKIYYNRPFFSGSSGIENCFKDFIKNGKLERYYKNGKSCEKFIVENKNTYIKYEGFYENGNLAFKGNCSPIRFEIDGPFESFYENGKLKERGNYNGDRLSGLYESFYENGKLKERGNYRGNYISGLYERFYENGKLKEKINLEFLGDGTFELFYENGKLKERGNYRDFKKNGNYEKFYESGKVEEKGKYNDGYIRGNYERFYENGKLKEKGNYSYSDKKDGTYEYYSQNGKLIKKESYKEGELI